LLRRIRRGAQQAPVPHGSTTGAIVSARNAALSLPPNCERTGQRRRGLLSPGALLSAISRARAALAWVRAGKPLRSARECFASTARRVMMPTGRSLTTASILSAAVSWLAESPKLSGPVLRNGAGGGAIAFPKSNRLDGPGADDRNGDHAHVGGRAISDFARFCFAGCRESVADSSAGTRTGARSEKGGAGLAGGRAIATIGLGVRPARRR
jgi:hypothetical protein